MGVDLQKYEAPNLLKEDSDLNEGYGSEYDDEEEYDE